MKRLLALDCDLTVCPSDIGWFEYLRKKDAEYFLKYGNSYKYIPKDGMLPYNLGELYPKLENTADYWRELDYSQFTPIEGSVEKLKALSQYFGIVFISANKGTHTKSKYYWLKENFPFLKGYMATKEKFLMNDSVVAMIDDRKDILEKFDTQKRVLYQTPYTQSTECSVAMQVDSWNNFSVENFCKQYL